MKLKIVSDDFLIPLGGFKNRLRPFLKPSKAIFDSPTPSSEYMFLNAVFTYNVEGQRVKSVIITNLLRGQIRLRWQRRHLQQSQAATLSTSTVYTYGDIAHKHAVTSLSTGETYTYDANGNMICRVENSITYKQDFNAENQLSAVSIMSGGCNGTVTATTSFVYDGDGNLVKKIKPDSSKTIYIGGIYEVDRTSGTPGTVTRTVTYYPAGGAMRINISGGSNTVYYLLKDHLGSASVVTDSYRVTVGEQRYYPYGETRLTIGTIYTDKLYTGQREMTGVGIYNYGARMYDPKLGRFLSADTIVPNPYNPQDLNRFGYVRNNPLRYVDPTGHMVSCEPGDVCDPTPLNRLLPVRCLPPAAEVVAGAAMEGMELGVVERMIHSIQIRIIFNHQ